MFLDKAVRGIVHNITYQKILPLAGVMLMAISLYMVLSKVYSTFEEDGLKVLLVLFVTALTLRFFGSYFGTLPEYFYTAVGNVIRETGRYGMCMYPDYCFPAYKPYAVFTGSLGFLFKLGWGNLFTARAFNIIIGSLTVFPSALLEKAFTGRNRNILPVIITFLPLHIITSFSMEAYASAFFFITSSIALLKLDDETITTIYSGFAVLSAFMSKPHAGLLFIPLIIKLFRERKDLKEYIPELSLLTGFSIIFFPIYYLFIFFQNSVVPGGRITEGLFKAFGRISGNYLTMGIVVLGVLSLIHNFLEQKHRSFIYYTLLVSLPVFFHQRTTFRLWIPFFLLMAFNAGLMISERFDHSKTFLVLLGIMGTFTFLSVPAQPHYIFRSEEKLSKTAEKLDKTGKIVSNRDDLITSVSNVNVLSLQLYRFEGNYTKVHLFASENCSDVIKSHGFLENYFFLEEVEVDSLYRFCTFGKAS